MKVTHIVLVAIAAAGLSACCYRPCPRPCAPAAPSYCAPACSSCGMQAKPVRKVYKDETTTDNK